MIKLNYEVLNSPSFNHALLTLKSTVTDGKTAYQISKIVRSMKKFQVQVRADFESEILSKYVTKTKDGQWKTEDTPHGKDYAIDPAVMADYEGACDEFGKRVIELEASPLPVEAVYSMQLSADSLEALTPVLTELKVIEGGKA